MDPNQNPPNDRELTIEERKEFFASQDAGTTLNRFGEITGVHVNRINPPAQGWPIALYCPICKETTLVLSPWAIKPSDGDYWKMNEVCGNPDLTDKHNIQMAMDSIWGQKVYE